MLMRHMHNMNSGIYDVLADSQHQSISIQLVMFRLWSPLKSPDGTRDSLKFRKQFPVSRPETDMEFG
jgi:hypothetical protein